MGALSSLNLIALLVGSLVLPMPAGAVGVLFSDSGTDAASIQDGVGAFRTALGNPNNLNNPGPLATGRREINWDGGGGVNTNAVAGTSFNGFLDTRGAQFTTPGTGFVQGSAGGRSAEWPGGAIRQSKLCDNFRGIQSRCGSLRPSAATSRMCQKTWQNVAAWNTRGRYDARLEANDPLRVREQR